MKKIFYLLLVLITLVGHSFGQLPTYLAYLPMNGDVNDLSDQTSPTHSNLGIQQIDFDRNDKAFSALNFTGTEYVSLGKMNALNNTLSHCTISFWAKSSIPSPSKFETIFKTINDGDRTLVGMDFHRRSDFSFHKDWLLITFRDENGFTLNFSVKSNLISDGKWHMYTIIVNDVANNGFISGSDIDVFIDSKHYQQNSVGGVVEVSYFGDNGISTPIPHDFGAFTYDFYLGGANNRGTFSDGFKGSLDDFKILNGNVPLTFKGQFGTFTSQQVNEWRDSYTPPSASCNSYLNLDGNDDYLELQERSMPNAQFTIEFWFKPTFTKSQGNPTLISSRTGNLTNWSIHLDRAYQGLKLWNGSSVLSIDYPFSLDRWYYVAFTNTWQNPGTTNDKIYINGQLQYEGQYLGPNYSADITLLATMGAVVNGNGFVSEAFKGGIDEIKIYKRKVLTDTEIEKNWRSLTGLDPFIHYNFSGYQYKDEVDDILDEGNYATGDGFVHLSGGNFNATIHNASVTTMQSGSLVKKNLAWQSIDDFQNVTVEMDQNSLATSISAESYQWLACKTHILSGRDYYEEQEGETNNLFNPIENGQYAVAATTSNGCEFISDCMLYEIPLKVKKNENSQELRAYPNPSSGTVKLSFIDSKTIEDIKVNNSSGQTIEHVALSGNQIQINHGPGIYFIHVKDLQGTWHVHKMIIE